MTKTHDAEKVKRLVSISAITFDALKGLSALPDEFDNACDFVMNLEKLPEWQKLLFAGLKLGAVLVEFDAAGRISEEEK